MIARLISGWADRKRAKQLREFRVQLGHILHVNDDILANSAKEKVREIISETEKVNSESAEETEKFLERAPLRVAKILPRKRWPTLCEYADIFAVAFTVAFGARALFLQPFKIPTSSMQPTLFGIHYVADKDTLPRLPSVFQGFIFGAQRAELQVKRSGYIEEEKVFPYSRYYFLPRSRFTIGGVTYELPGEWEGDGVGDTVKRYCKLTGRLDFTEGEVLCKGWLVSGDHLFVDRFTYHFRDPRRGDIVVFNTEDLPCRDRGFFYIKRLIGMPGDTLKIVNSKVHVKEKGKKDFIPITDFGIAEVNRVYSGKGGYHGHTATGSLWAGEIEGRKFENEVEVPEDCYFMMGDNSRYRSDSRAWGFVPRRNIVGKAFFIFWPYSRRWGFPDHAEPLPVATGDEPREAMELQ